MQKFLITLSLFFLVSCTLHRENSIKRVNVSGEVPQEAKMVDGYSYPAIPLDDYNKIQTEKQDK